MKVLSGVTKATSGRTDEFKTWCGYYGQCLPLGCEDKAVEYANYLQATFGEDFVRQFIVHLVCLINHTAKQKALLKCFQWEATLDWLTDGGDLIPQFSMKLDQDPTGQLPKDVVLRHDKSWLYVFDGASMLPEKRWPWYKVTDFEAKWAGNPKSFAFTVSSQFFLFETDTATVLLRVFQRRAQGDAGVDAVPPPPSTKPEDASSPKSSPRNSPKGQSRVGRGSLLSSSSPTAGSPQPPSGSPAARRRSVGGGCRATSARRSELWRRVVA